MNSLNNNSLQSTVLADQIHTEGSTPLRKMKTRDIKVEDRIREVDESKVDELMESISVLGIIQPITVDKNGKLIGGAHRLEAYLRLGIEEVHVVVLDLSELKCELAEIDENLIRNELHWLEFGEQVLRRDKVLAKMGMRAKAGDNQHAKGSKSKRAKGKTTADTARELGTKERTLQENIQIARNLVEEAKDAVRKLDLKKSLALKISRLKHDEQRKVVAHGSPEEILEAVAKINAKEQDDATCQDYISVVYDVLNDMDSIVSSYSDAAELAATEEDLKELKELQGAVYAKLSAVTSEFQALVDKLAAPKVATPEPQKSADNPEVSETGDGGHTDARAEAA